MAADLPKEVKAEFERRAWEMRISGEKNLAAIAAELINPATGKPISTSTVSRMLSRVEQRLAKEFANQAEHVKARQTALLERIVDEALDAWRRSKEPAETVTVTQGRAANREGEVVPLPDQVVRQVRIRWCGRCVDRRGIRGSSSRRVAPWPTSGRSGAWMRRRSRTSPRPARR